MANSNTNDYTLSNSDCQALERLIGAQVSARVPAAHMEDAKQAAWTEVVKAAPMYRPEAGALSTYFFLHIQGAIRHYLTHSLTVVRPTITREDREAKGKGKYEFTHKEVSTSAPVGGEDSQGSLEDFLEAYRPSTEMGVWGDNRPTFTLSGNPEEQLLQKEHIALFRVFARTLEAKELSLYAQVMMGDTPVAVWAKENELSRSYAYKMRDDITYRLKRFVGE